MLTNHIKDPPERLTVEYEGHLFFCELDADKYLTIGVIDPKTNKLLGAVAIKSLDQLIFIDAKRGQISGGIFVAPDHRLTDATIGSVTIWYIWDMLKRMGCGSKFELSVGLCESNENGFVVRFEANPVKED